MLTGKGLKSLVKKDLLSEKSPAVAISKTMFQHKAAAGDTTINLLNLNTPSEALANGFVQPSAAQIANLGLQSNYKNLLLISATEGKVLAPYVSYSVSGTLITLVEPALEDEIFIGIIDPIIRSDSLVADVDFILATGTLTAGYTDINVGKPFKVNLNPDFQEGAVSLEIEGQSLLRNVGNATANPSADGDYQEVPDTSGQYSSLLRLNNAFSSDVAYKVKSTALSVIRPDGSLVADLERIQGIIDKVIEICADGFGLVASDFKAAPSSQQLNQFGDRVVSLEKYKVLTTNTTLSQAPVQLIAADTSLGGFTITLPALPGQGDRVLIMDAKRTFGSGNLTVARNGNNIAGIADDLVITVTGDWVELVFITSYGWSVRQ